MSQQARPPQPGPAADEGAEDSVAELTTEVDDTELTGLNLFDDRASAAGSFPHGMWGYERQAVDGYVRDLEKQISTLRQLTKHLRREMATLQSRTPDTDFSRLGSYATSMLRAAEGQAAELISRAGLEAERIKEEARRVAADMRAGAQTEADDVRMAALGNMRRVREQLDRDVEKALNDVRTESASIVDAARRQAENLTKQAKTTADMTIQQAEANARELTDGAKRQSDDTLKQATTEAERIRIGAAEGEQQAHQNGEQILADARRKAEALLSEARAQADELARQAAIDADKVRNEAQETANKTRADASTEAEQTRAAAAAEAERVRAEIADLMTQAKAQHDESTEHVNQLNEQAAKIRAEALAAAEQTRADAATEAENQIGAAHRQAAMMRERLEEQFGWRKEQLERETAVLLQRKDAILAQFESLKTLGLGSADELPNADPFDSLELPTAHYLNSEQNADQLDADEQWLAAGAKPKSQANEESTKILDRNALPPELQAQIDAKPADQQD